MQSNNTFFIQDLINIKAGTLIAGLLGALVTMLRKSEGSLQARITGYIIAIISVLYLVPFLVWGIEWKFGLILHTTAENMLSFIFGMISQTLTEAFVDDPLGSCYKWAEGLKKLKRVVWNGEAMDVKNEPIPKSEDVKK